MTLQQIGYFIKLAEELNFTSVARIFYITQPTLSRQILNLEEELNIPLFVREHKTVRLTDAGDYFYQKMKPLYNQMMEEIRLTRNFDRNNNTIVIGVQEEQSISESLLEAIGNIHRKHSELRIDVVRAEYLNLIEGLEPGRYDLVNAICFPVYLNREILEFEELAEEEPYLIIARSLVFPEDLEKEEADKDLLIKYLKQYPLILSAIYDDRDPELPKRIFAENNGIRSEDIKILNSDRLLSVPIQVAAQMGISICNETNLHAINKNIKMFRLSQSKDHYKKGLFCRANSSRPFVRELIREALKVRQKTIKEKS